MNLINQIVVHKKFGEGKIISQNGKYISVSFFQKTIDFLFPDVFVSFLKCTNAALQAELEEAFATAEKEKQEAKLRAREDAQRRAEEAEKQSFEKGKSSYQKKGMSKSVKNLHTHKNYAMISEIEATLRQFRPDYADEIAGINQIRATLSNSGKLKFDDHVKAMILSLLSNRQEWDKIEKNLDELRVVFCDYDFQKLMLKSETTILNELTALKCGNQAIRRQISHLKTNIRTLERIAREQGDLDHYYSVTDKYILVDKLSNSESEYKLHDMGVALVCEYLKGVGISVVKPDTHTRRIIGRLGFSEKNPAEEIETLRICDEIVNALNMSHALVDTILWQYGVEKKCGICGEEPDCARCGVTSCPSRKVNI